MHTVERLEELLLVAKQLGYKVRHEWLDGSAGGACEFGGRKWLFVDLALNSSEQLEQVIGGLQTDSRLSRLPGLSHSARELLGLPKAA